MSFGLSTRLIQYTVEFVPSVGIRTNNIVDTSQGTSGPFIWTVPDGVVELNIGMCSGGAGGAGGGASAASVISVGGGGGGRGGDTIISNMPAVVYPNTKLQITLGSAGTGGAIGSPGGLPGITTVTGYLGDPGIIAAYHDGISGRLSCGDWGWRTSSPGLSSTSTWANGGDSGGNTDLATAGQGATTNASAGGTGMNVGTNGWLFGSGFIAQYFSFSGAGGASGASSGASNGGSNIYFFGGGGNLANGTSTQGGGSGNTTGTLSRGAGGSGGGSAFGYGGRGGDGGSPGGTGLGWGAGGGGGGGNAPGANGTPGYVRFIYWKAD